MRTLGHYRNISIRKERVSETAHAALPTKLEGSLFRSHSGLGLLQNIQQLKYFCSKATRIGANPY